MQTVGTFLELSGAIITAIGLFYAWNRASGRFDQWREDLATMLAELNALITSRGRIGPNQTISPVGIASSEEFGCPTVTVESREEMPERLHRVENDVAKLKSSVSQANTSIASMTDKIDAAIAEKLAEFDAVGEGFAVKDIYWALAGIAIGAVGLVLEIADIWI